MFHFQKNPHVFNPRAPRQVHFETLHFFSSQDDVIRNWHILRNVLLVARRATYVVDGRFFGHFFWKVEGTVRTHVNSRVADVWLPYTVINV